MQHPKKLQYVEGPLLEGLYVEEWYNGLDIPKNETGYILHENRLLGKPRLRMLKVRNDSCKVADDFEKHIDQCYASYREEREDHNSFGLNNGTA